MMWELCVLLTCVPVEHVQGKVRGFPKSARFVISGPWMSVICPIAVETCQSGPTDGQTLHPTARCGAWRNMHIGNFKGQSKKTFTLLSYFGLTNVIYLIFKNILPPLSNCIHLFFVFSFQGDGVLAHSAIHPSRPRCPQRVGGKRQFGEDRRLWPDEVHPWRRQLLSRSRGRVQPGVLVSSCRTQRSYSILCFMCVCIFYSVNQIKYNPILSYIIYKRERLKRYR